MKNPLFYAKILLFGEYGIIRNAKGLSIPYNTYKGTLKKGEVLAEKQQSSNHRLYDFLNFLKTQGDTIHKNINLELFEKDLKEGTYFDSSIPSGYGVGSSGALVAAIYDRYAINKITVLQHLTKDKLLYLKELFATMESFFHGKSSGLDPLNSYLSIPLLINSSQHIETTGIPSQKEGNGAVFLLDSKLEGKTAPMVSIFMDRMKNEGFRNMVHTEFTDYTNACIHHFLKGEATMLLNNVKKLSTLVFENFKPMIPKALHTLWKKGIESNTYFLKLCGSGGGGYVLGFTKDFNKTTELLKDYRLELVYRF